VFTKENLNNCPNKGNSPYQTMSDIKINCKGVTKLLKNQNIHKATGPDPIPSGEDLVFVEMVHDVAVDYMLQYLTCDGGEGNRSIVGG
jgi:hypothetical protein